MKYQVLFSHNEPHSTIDAGIIAEGSSNDGGLAAGTEGIGLEMLPQGVEEDISGTGDTATHPETWTMLQKPFDFDCKNGDAIAAFVDALQ